MTFDAKKNLEAFGRALGNEKRTIGVIADAMQNVRDNDASQLAKMLEMARRRGDAKAVSAIRLMIGKVWEGVKIDTPERSPVVVKIKCATFNAEALAIVVQAGIDELSLRGPGIKARFKKPEPETGNANGTEIPAAPAFDAMAFILKLSPADRDAVRAALVQIDAAELMAEAA